MTNLLRFLTGGGGSKYRYTKLSYRPSLREDRSVPLAVIAQMEVEGGQLWVVMGRQPPVEATTELGQRILDDIPSWLRSQLEEAFEDSDDPVAYLAANHPFNLSFASPRERRADDFLRDVVGLFAEEVLGVDVEVVVSTPPRPALPGTGQVGEERFPETPFSWISMPGVRGRRRAHA